MQELYHQVKMAKETAPPQLPFLLLGNKCDLESSRAIPRADAEALAEGFGVRYLETSAKTRAGVSEAFCGLVEEVVAARAPKETLLDGNSKRKRCSGLRKLLSCGLVK